MARRHAAASLFALNAPCVAVVARSHPGRRSTVDHQLIVAHLLYALADRIQVDVLAREAVYLGTLAHLSHFSWYLMPNIQLSVGWLTASTTRYSPVHASLAEPQTVLTKRIKRSSDNTSVKPAVETASMLAGGLPSPLDFGGCPCALFIDPGRI